MKNLKQGALIFAFLIIGTVPFGQNREVKEQLIISGILLSQKDVVGEEKILLYEGENAIGSTISTDLGYFEFELDYDKLYHIVIGSERYKMKWLTIGTNIPDVDREDNHMANLIINVDPRPGNPEYRIVKTLAQK